jgi:hypothetical protein
MCFASEGRRKKNSKDILTNVLERFYFAIGPNASQKGFCNQLEVVVLPFVGLITSEEICSWLIA